MAKARFTAISVERFRADAKTQRALGLKVGGTATKFLVQDNERQLEGYVTAYGATPGERKSAAINQFRCGVCDRGAKPTPIRTLEDIRASLERTDRELQAFIAAAESGDL